MSNLSQSLKKAQILASSDVITPERLSTELGVHIQTAFNTVSLWHKQGAIKKIAHGCYVSLLCKEEKTKQTLQTIQKKYGNEFTIAGISAWAFQGYASSDVIHIVGNNPRSAKERSEIEGVRYYAIGAVEYKHLQKYVRTIQTDIGPVKVVNADSQFVWWLQPECPVDLPHPKLIDWKKTREGFNNLNEAILNLVRQSYAELRNIEGNDAQSLYMMAYMDHITKSGELMEHNSWQEFQDETDDDSPLRPHG